MIRTALIGLGKMGISHLSVLGAHPDIDMVAVCDPSKTLLGAFRQVKPDVKTHADYNDMFAAEALDAVVIATPSRFHADIVRAALAKGLHVFCEKPFCLDPIEGAELADIAEAKGLVNHVGYHYRHVGAFQEAKRLIDAGVIGQVHNIRAEASGPVVLRPQGATWRSSKAEGGGCLYDYASHGLDLMNFLVGAPQEVRGTVLNKVFSRDVDDEVYSMLFYPNGMTGQILANWSDESQRKMSMKVTVSGTGGKIIADRQEIQTFVREEDVAQANGLKKGWNVQYTTELTEEVWFYLRGEEYSAQIDAFAGEIGKKSDKNVSSFRTALATDVVIGQMQRDAAGIAAPVRAPVAPVKKGLLSSILGNKR